MPKIVSVDAAIRKNMPYVEFRGELYRLRDLTLRERMKRILEFQERQELAEAEEEKARADLAAAVSVDASDGGVENESPDVDVDELRARVEERTDLVLKVHADAICHALEDFPRDLAQTMTEREIQVMHEAIQEAAQVVFPVDVEEVEDLKGRGRAAG